MERNTTMRQRSLPLTVMVICLATAWATADDAVWQIGEIDLAV